MFKQLQTKSLCLAIAMMMGGAMSVSAADKWVKTAPADLTTGDVVVIVDQTSGTAMSNNNGTSSAPSATSVTLSEDKSEITGDVDATLQWEVTVSNGSYQFGVTSGNTTSYLYATATNNGLRVGSNENNLFTIVTDENNNQADFLFINTTNNKGTVEDRYIGVYNSQDWRCYTSINNNIKATVTAFYKKTVDENAKPNVATINGISPTKVAMEASGNFTFDVTYTDNVTANDVTISWVSDNEDVLANIDGEYLAGAKGVANVTVTITPNNADAYEAVSEEFAVIVYDPNANDGSADHPYTVEEAREAIDLSAGVEGVYAKGIVSAIVTPYDSNYGNITYDITSDGSTESVSLRAYRGKSYNGDNFTSEDDIQVGDTVVVYGNLTLYGSTYEFASNNQLVSLNRPEAPAVPTISVDETEVSIDAEGGDGTIRVAFENFDNFDAELVFYDADGAEIDEPAWIATTLYVENSDIDYLVEENTGDARTAYLKVYATDGDNDYYSPLITITQAAFVAPAEEIGNFVKVTSTADITDGQYLIVYENGLVAFDGSLETLDAVSNTINVEISNDTIVATTENIGSAFTIDVTNGTLQSASGLYIGVSSNSNGLKQTDNAETYSNSFEIDEEGNAVISAVFEGSKMTLRFNSASNQARFRYYKDNGQKAIQLYKFIPNTISATVTYAGWATWVPEFNVEVPKGVSAYYVTGTTDTNVILEELLTIPAGEPVVLQGEGTHQFSVINDNELISADEENKLMVSDGSITADDGVYVLANHNNEVGFYKWGGESNLAAGRVYLPVEAGSRSFLGFGNGTSTGIEAVESVETSGSMFDLQGRHVMQPTKGLYIVGGKKVIVK